MDLQVAAVVQHLVHALVKSQLDFCNVELPVKNIQKWQPVQNSSDRWSGQFDYVGPLHQQLHKLLICFGGPTEDAGVNNLGPGYLPIPCLFLPIS